VHQPVHQGEDVYQVGADVIRFGDAQVHQHLRQGGILQDAHRQCQPGCLAADLAGSNPPPVNGFEILDGQPVPRHADVGKLVADQPADEHHLDLPQARFILQPLLRGQVFNCQRLGKQQAFRRQLGIK